MRTGVDFDVSDEQRKRLEEITDGGKSKVKPARRARIILLTDDGLGTMAVMDGAGVSSRRIRRWQRRFMQEGLVRQDVQAVNAKVVSGREPIDSGRAIKSRS